MIQIKIPATSANLGAGYDSLGLALNYFNHVEMQEYDKIEIKSVDDIIIPTDSNNLIYKTIDQVYNYVARL